MRTNHQHEPAMTEAVKRPRNVHEHYHAHLYYDADTLDYAAELSRRAGERFGVEVGRVHRKCVGPHPRWSCQLAFDRADFEALIPWLDEERKGLSVFVHGSSGDDWVDHTDYAYWLGEPVPLNLSFFETIQSASKSP